MVSSSLVSLAFLGNLAGPDMIIILIVALLIFGRRLPEVGKNLGKTIVEFKKGINGAATADHEEEVVVDDEANRPSKTVSRPTARLQASGGPTAAIRKPVKSLPTSEEI